MPRRPGALALVFASLTAGPVLCDPTVTSWSQVAVKAIVDNKLHTNFGSRLQAAMHTAQWRAANDVLKAKGLTASSNLDAVQDDLQAAVANAGKAVLLGLLPGANVSVSKLYDAQVTSLQTQPKAAVEAGSRAADLVLSERKADGSSPPPPDMLGSNDTGKWRPTPPQFAPLATPQWANVTPWVMSSPSQFRVDPPPTLDSDVFRQSYMEVMDLGNRTSKSRTPEQNETSLFFNGNTEVILAQLIDQVTANMSLMDSLRVYTTSAVAVADVRIAAWNNKLLYMMWRPVTAIPLGNGVKFPADAQWQAAHHTSPTPEYPVSTVATAEAVFEVLRGLGFGDAVNATLSSPSHPTLKMPVTSLANTSATIADSRVWGGQHFRHALAPSVTLGRAVAKVALDKYGKDKARRLRRA